MNFCKVIGLDLTSEAKYKENANRVQNREELTRLIEEAIGNRDVGELVNELRKMKVPCGKVNDLKQVFEEE